MQGKLDARDLFFCVEQAEHVYHMEYCFEALYLNGVESNYCRIQEVHKWYTKYFGVPAPKGLHFLNV